MANGSGTILGFILGVGVGVAGLWAYNEYVVIPTVARRHAANIALARRRRPAPIPTPYRGAAQRQIQLTRARGPVTRQILPQRALRPRFQLDY